MDKFDELSKAIIKAKSNKKESYDTSATVTRIAEDKLYVQLDGSDIDTPCTSTATCKVGDRVRVRISNHRCWVIGNISSPSVGNAEIQEVEKQMSTMEEKRAKAEKKVMDQLVDASNSAKAYIVYVKDVGLKIGDISDKRVDKNLLLKPDGVYIMKDSTELAKFLADTVNLSNGKLIVSAYDVNGVKASKITTQNDFMNVTVGTDNNKSNLFMRKEQDDSCITELYSSSSHGGGKPWSGIAQVTNEVNDEHSTSSLYAQHSSTAGTKRTSVEVIQKDDGKSKAYIGADEISFEDYDGLYYFTINNGTAKTSNRIHVEAPEGVVICSGTDSGKACSLHAPKSGNRGLYDNTVGQWDIYRDSNNLLRIPSELYLQGHSTPVGYRDSKSNTKNISAGTVTAMDSIALSAGTWILNAFMNFSAGSGTSNGSCQVMIGTTSASTSNLVARNGTVLQGANSANVGCTGTIKLSASTTVYFNAFSSVARNSNSYVFTATRIA